MESLPMFEEVLVHTNEEWLNIRSTVLTATEVSIILGLNSFKSVSEMLKEKRDPQPFENAYTFIGQLMEPLVVTITNKVLDTKFKLYESSTKSFFLDKELRLGATPDAHDDTMLLECKTTRPANFLRYSGHPPAYYLAQLYTQLICTNRTTGYLAIMSTDLSQKSPELKLPIHVFALTRLDRLDAYFFQEVKRFWETIDSDKQYRVNRKQTLTIELLLRILTKRIH